MIMAGRARVVAAMMWLMNDGTMWTKIVRIWLQPTSRAETTKSSSRRVRKRPRTTRASSVQARSEMMMVMAKYTCKIVQCRGRAAASPIHNGMVGIERRISMIRWITVSARPP